MLQRICIGCGVVLISRYKIKFCSNRCQHKYRGEVFVADWKAGKVSGIVGRQTKVLSRHIRSYLLRFNQSKCSLCGWNEVNPVTQLVPLEIDHIDGNPENNLESNLRLLCPNCHSLTPFFRALNKGRGRAWRLKRE